MYNLKSHIIWTGHSEWHDWQLQPAVVVVFFLFGVVFGSVITFSADDDGSCRSHVLKSTLASFRLQYLYEQLIQTCTAHFAVPIGNPAYVSNATCLFRHNANTFYLQTTNTENFFARCSSDQRSVWEMWVLGWLGERLWEKIVRQTEQRYVMDSIRWIKQIRDDWWPRWSCVGECFFWYRLTRVVPDKKSREP